MSALPPKADKGGRGWNVCFGPIADIKSGLCEPSRKRAASDAMMLVNCKIFNPIDVGS
jgi:hypothetical protein